MEIAAKHETAATAGGESGPRAGPILAAWVALTIALQAATWSLGVRPVGLAQAVERGAATVETRGIGEVGDDVVRKAIQTQRATLAFWRTLALLGDFAAEPMALVGRAFVVATALAGVAALAGRPIGFGAALAGSAAAQGYWVLGQAVRVGLMVILRRPGVETSLTLLLPPGTHPATTWVALSQLDLFALLGWTALAVGGWRRGQASLPAAALVCGSLAVVEATTRITWALVTEAGMRLTLIPEWISR
jgi:hypothetical protein